LTNNRLVSLFTVTIAYRGT